MRDSMKVDLLLLFHRSIFRNINKKPIQVFALLFCLGLSGTLLAQSGEEQIKIVMPTDARVIRVDAKIDQWVYAGDTLAVLKDSKGAKFKFRAGVSGQLVFWRLRNLKHYGAGETVGILRIAPVIVEEVGSGTSVVALPAFNEMLLNLYNSTGLASLFRGQGLDWTEGFGRLIMIGVGLILLYLGIRRAGAYRLWRYVVQYPFSRSFGAGRALVLCLRVWYNHRNFSFDNFHGSWCNDRFRADAGQSKNRFVGRRGTVRDFWYPPRRTGIERNSRH